MSYTRSQLKAEVNAKIHGKIGMLIDANATMDEAVREVNKNLDLSSSRRKVPLVPNLFRDTYEYACPADMILSGVIDIPAQAKRGDDQFFIVPSEEFDRKHAKGSISVDEYNGIKILKISSNIDSQTILLSALDSTISGGGTWTAIGDAENIRADKDDFINEAGSLAFDINTGAGTTAGVENTSLNNFDITDYMGGNGAVFVYTRINTPTDLTSYTLKIGSDNANYYQKTTTMRHDGTAFVAGWNLLRFDLTTLTTVGTPVNTGIDYVAIYMNKAVTKVSETDYKFDSLMVKKGQIHDVKYYSKFGWQDTTGAYKQNSTNDLDTLIAGEDEYVLIKKKATKLAAQEVNEFEIADIYAKEYTEEAKLYIIANPSESKIISNEYYKY